MYQYIMYNEYMYHEATLKLHDSIMTKIFHVHNIDIMK